MNEEIRKLAISNGIYDCICDPYDKLRNGVHHSSVMFDLERVAKLIIKETLPVARAGIEFGDGMEDAVYKYFGIEE